MEKYNVIEYRGCDIQYPVYSGTKEECEAYLASVANDDGSSKEGEVNGDGWPFYYHIEEDDPIWNQSARALKDLESSPNEGHIGPSNGYRLPHPPKKRARK